MEDYRRAALSRAERAMLDFAIKLTRSPASLTEADVTVLRTLGFEDVAIHDIVQITALFNYYNRLVDGLGIEPEV